METGQNQLMAGIRFTTPLPGLSNGLEAAPSAEPRHTTHFTMLESTFLRANSGLSQYNPVVCDVLKDGQLAGMVLKVTNMSPSLQEAAKHSLETMAERMMGATKYTIEVQNRGGTTGALGPF